VAGKIRPFNQYHSTLSTWSTLYFRLWYRTQSLRLHRWCRAKKPHHGWCRKNRI